MSNRIRIYTKVSPEELARIHKKMSEMQTQNRSAYLRKMALDGYCVCLDDTAMRELVSLLRRCSNNLNQYARKANGINKIYARDIEDLQERLDQLWDAAKEIMSKMSRIR